MTERAISGLRSSRWLHATLGALHAAWQCLRTLSGDDAYERYLAHRRNHPADHADAPLDRRDFFRREQTRKWNGVRRCC